MERAVKAVTPSWLFCVLMKQRELCDLLQWWDFSQLAVLQKVQWFWTKVNKQLCQPSTKCLVRNVPCLFPSRPRRLRHQAHTETSVRLFPLPWSEELWRVIVFSASVLRPLETAGQKHWKATWLWRCYYGYRFVSFTLHCLKLSLTTELSTQKVVTSSGRWMYCIASLRRRVPKSCPPQLSRAGCSNYPWCLSLRRRIRQEDEPTVCYTPLVRTTQCSPFFPRPFKWRIVAVCLAAVCYEHRRLCQLTCACWYEQGEPSCRNTRLETILYFYQPCQPEHRRTAALRRTLALPFSEMCLGAFRKFLNSETVRSSEHGCCCVLPSLVLWVGKGKKFISFPFNWVERAE